MSAVGGLTANQVQERRLHGQGNDVKLTTSRSTKDIIVTNVFNPVNIVLYAIGLGMVLVGDLKSAFATVMLVVFNAILGITQEVRAKKQLDRIALLARAKVTVRRDGEDQQVDPSELVLGDVLVIQAGDQIPVDGRVLGDGKMDVDESALTGESDLVSKTGGDQVMSGTFCMTGKALVEATGVGESSFAIKLTQNAREFKLETTPLQNSVNRLLRVLLLIVAFYALLAVLSLFVLDMEMGAWLQVLAVITGSVSAGLLTLITLNYSWGSVRVGQKGGLVQQINAIESLSNVTVLCADKTGTLTANRIQYHDSHPTGVDKPEFEQLLADFAASASATNKTSEAIIEALPGVGRNVTGEVSFSSARKWSAIIFDDPGSDDRAPLKGAYVLGAMEMLQPYLTIDADVGHRLEEWSSQGLRVLAFARNTEQTSFRSDGDEPTLPQLTLLGIVSFSDELRPHIQETIAAFADNDIRLKVISGDSPQTVAALARQAGLPGALNVVSGPELAQMGAAEFAETALDTTIFGRITPQQKEALVDALRSRGEYVAMMGDGVNDVLSLKKANIGIAMESGSTATRAVAAMILLGDSFEVMPEAFTEGQRIVNSIQDILKLFMSTVFALLLLIVGIRFLGIGFPFTQLQSTLLSFFARGVPPFVLAITAVATRPRGGLLKNIIRFTLPASFLLFLFGLLLYTGVYFAIDNHLAEVNLSPEAITAIGQHVGRDFSSLPVAEFERWVRLLTAQTALTTFFVLAGVLLMVFAQPPFRWLAGDADTDVPTVNWLPTVVAVILILGYGLVMAMPRMRQFFDLVPLPASILGLIVIATLIWAVAQRAVWRARLLERFLDMELNEQQPGA